LFVVPALLALRAFSSLGPSTDTRTPTAGDPPAAVSNREAIATGAARLLVRDAQAARQDALAQRAQALAWALETGDCRLANERANDLIHSRLSDSGMQREAEDVARRAFEACGGWPTTPATSSATTPGADP
jgi:hypothetical protein